MDRKLNRAKQAESELGTDKLKGNSGKKKTFPAGNHLKNLVIS